MIVPPKKIIFEFIIYFNTKNIKNQEVFIKLLIFLFDFGFYPKSP